MDEAEPIADLTSSLPDELTTVPGASAASSSSASYAGPPSFNEEKPNIGLSNFGSGAATKRPRAAKSRTKSDPNGESSTASKAAPSAKRPRKNQRGAGAIGNATLDSYFNDQPSTSKKSTTTNCVGGDSGSGSEDDDVKLELDPDVRAILQAVQREEQQNLHQQQRTQRTEEQPKRESNDEPVAGEWEMTEEELDKLCGQIDVEDYLPPDDSSAPSISIQPVTTAPRRSHASLSKFAHIDSDTNEDDDSLSLNNSPLPVPFSQRSDAGESVSFSTSPAPCARSKLSQISSITITLDSDDDW